MHAGNGKTFHAIVAVDGSEHSKAALSMLHSLPLPEGSCITAIAVILPRNASDFAVLEGVLKDAAAILESPVITVRTELLSGFPAEMLAGFAESDPPDLMVMGAKGLRSTFGILLGGVAQQLIEYATWPVMIVRSPFGGIKRILLAVDGSEYSRCALEYMTRMSLPQGCEVDLIHILPPALNIQQSLQYFPHGAEMYVPAVPQTEAEMERLKRVLEDEERQGQALLAEFSSVLEQVGIAVTCHLRRGDAASEILQYNEHHPIDLIVAGSRGLGGMKGLLLGSVSRKLAHYGKSSILVVKGGKHGES